MKKYLIRINCPCFEDIEVEAKTKGEAIDTAIAEFNCPGGDAEFCEILEVNTTKTKLVRDI